MSTIHSAAFSVLMFVCHPISWAAVKDKGISLAVNRIEIHQSNRLPHPWHVLKANWQLCVIIIQLFLLSTLHTLVNHDSTFYIPTFGNNTLCIDSRGNKIRPGRSTCFKWDSKVYYAIYTLQYICHSRNKSWYWIQPENKCWGTKNLEVLGCVKSV